MLALTDGIDKQIALNKGIMHKKISLQPSESNKFWLSHAAPALIFALLMSYVYPHMHWDTRLTNLFYDAQLQKFPLKQNSLLSLWLHVGLKWMIVWVALTCLALALASIKWAQLRADRTSYLWVFVAMLVSTSVVATLKHYSQHACPWDINLYGGNLPLFDLWTTPPLSAEAGRCFPAGHPSAGFSLMAFYFAFKHSKPRFAKYMLWLGMVLGLVMGATQIMRGAHFLSHVLWTGWVVWVVLLAMFWICPIHRPKNHQSS